jgi:DNA-binding NtrC family response regulator
MYRVLIGDDDETILKGIRFHLQEQEGLEIVTAETKEEALNFIETDEFDAVIVDLMFPEADDGLAVIKCARNQMYRPLILAMTAYESVENAVATIQAGADDFAVKGFTLDELMIRVENLIKRKKELQHLTIENEILRQTVRQQFNDYQIIGLSKQIKELMGKVLKIAEDAYATCLIEGESGSGKDLFARTIHMLSKRNYAPFIPINCAAIPDNLLESELFGHERGSFTGAYASRQGIFEQAHEGVLFLDEISELPMPLQGVLLRALEEKEIYRIGGKRPIRVNVMILAASNRDVEQLVHRNRFREDLFFRLNVIKITIPPLREHPEDIEPLALFFLEKFNTQRNKQLVLSNPTLAQLKNYTFPGNVRELRNIIEDAFVFCTGNIIHPSDLRFKQHRKFHNRNIRTTGNREIDSILQVKYQTANDEFDKIYFTELLNKNNWNMKKTAEDAGISREWLCRKLKQLSITNK